jgi:hypothetical protein
VSFASNEELKRLTAQVADGVLIASKRLGTDASEEQRLIEHPALQKSSSLLSFVC